MLHRACAYVGAVVLAAVLGLVLWGDISASQPARAHFAVKVDFPDGHGSGTHIGRGFVLTAAHVVEGRTPEIITDTGAKQPAAVLWINKDYDIALLRVADFSNIGEAPLSCAPLTIGTRYVAYGSPGKIDFVSSAGSVVGRAEKRGPWQSVATVDGTVVMGMSGGGVIANGRLVGVAVGVQAVQVGFSPSITGFGFVVPSSDICGLLAR